MDEDYQRLLQQATLKLEKAFALVAASVSDLPPYNPKYDYTPKELEPYDALSDRFVRCVEVFIRYFRTYEYYTESSNSQTYRDGLNKMAKLGLIRDVMLWLKMRDVRNKVVHDYLPAQTQQLFYEIMTVFFEELQFTKMQIDKISAMLV